MSNVFPDQADEDMWAERWCARCHQQDAVLFRLFNHGTGCQILARAHQGTVPPQWTRRRGSDDYECEAYLGQPEAVRVPKEPALPQEELFAEPEHEDKELIAVDGWPDRHAFGRRKR